MNTVYTDRVLQSEEELLEWIEHYERGEELPDEVLVKVLLMAQLYARENLR